MSYDKEYYREYRLKNKKKLALKNKVWRKNNPDKVKATHKRQKDSGYFSAYQAKYRKTVGCKYSCLRARAKRRGIDFCIHKNSFLYWFENQNRRCHYCKVETTMGVSGNRKRWLTIERVINTLPYALSNIVISCYRCNLIKSNDIGYEQMVKIGKVLAK